MRYLILLGLSMLPIIELRGALLYAAASGITFPVALAIAVVGNMIPVPFILFLFEKILNFFSRRRWIGPLLQRFWDRAEKKAATLGKYELLGVFLFVAIPLPGTGAWMGALVATVLHLDRRRVIACILGGVLCAGLIVSGLCYLLPDIFMKLFY